MPCQVIVAARDLFWRTVSLVAWKLLWTPPRQGVASGDMERQRCRK